MKKFLILLLFLGGTAVAAKWDGKPTVGNTIKASGRKRKCGAFRITSTTGDTMTLKLSRQVTGKKFNSRAKVRGNRTFKPRGALSYIKYNGLGRKEHWAIACYVGGKRVPCKGKVKVVYPIYNQRCDKSIAGAGYDTGYLNMKK